MEPNGYYTVTAKSALNSRRVAVSLYSKGELTGTKVICKDLGGLELTYDAVGRLTQKSLRLIQEARNSGYSFEFIGQTGFRITAGDAVEEGQSKDRARRDEKDHDVKQSVVLKIAGHQKTHSVRLHSFLAKKSVAFLVRDRGCGRSGAPATREAPSPRSCAPGRDSSASGRGRPGARLRARRDDGVSKCSAGCEQGAEPTARLDSRGRLRRP